MVIVKHPLWKWWLWCVCCCRGLWSWCDCVVDHGEYKDSSGEACSDQDLSSDASPSSRETGSVTLCHVNTSSLSLVADDW